MERGITVLVADDHKLFRKSFITLLRTFQRIDRIHEAGNGVEVFSVIKENHIDLVLLDMQMPVMDGEQTSAKILKEYPHVKVLIVSMFDDKHRVEKMLRLGVHGYVNKDTDADEVELAIYSVVDRGLYYNTLVANTFRAHHDTAPFGLTSREMEILTLICEEYTMKEIARMKHISEKTVQNHRASIMDKLSVSNTAGLVRVAVAQELFISK